MASHGSDSEEDFKPQTAVYSDEEQDRKTVVEEDGDDDEDDSHELETTQESRPVKRRRSDVSDLDAKETQSDFAGGESEVDDAKETRDGEDDDNDDGEEGEEEEDEDDEDDDDDDDDDGDESQKNRPRKRRKREAYLRFLDTEAHDDDDEVESEGEPEEDVHPDDALDAGASIANDDRYHQRLDRERAISSTWDAEKQAEELRRRYGKREKAVTGSVIPRRILLPTPEDPSIWVVKCSEGKEKDVLYNIMKRSMDRARTRKPLSLISAFFRSGVMGGHIYLEAHRKEDVLAVLEDMPGMYPRTKFQLIDINDMPSLLRVTKKRSVEVGEFVRIKRGLYSDDLAQVEDVDATTSTVRVRVVPRLTYGLNEQPGAAPEVRKVNNANGPRPPQKLFSEHEAEKRHKKFLLRVPVFGRKEFHYMQEVYVNGFLVKDFKLQALQTEDVNPTLEEAAFFAAGGPDGTENLDLQALSASLKGSANLSAYLPGDEVEIYKGEQQGLSGRIIDTQQDIARVEIAGTVTNRAGRGTIAEVSITSLRKRFRDGDHVKVTGGSRYSDEVGMVVRIVDDRVTILLDSNHQEITVFSKDLRLAADSGATHMNSKYDLHDLVQLNETTVGCVVKVDRESVRVIDQEGTVRTVLVSEIPNKVDSRRQAVAMDREGSEIRVGDTVKEASGNGQQGVVKHIHRHFLFIHNQVQLQNAGIFVARTISVTTVSAKGGRIDTGLDLTKMNPMLQRNVKTSMPPPPRFSGRDPIIGKSVRITAGSNKGLLGIAKDTMSTGVMVELHSKSKQVAVPRERLVIVDPVTGKPLEQGPRGGRGGYGSSSGAGGMGRGSGDRGGNSVWGGDGGGRTPMAGGATPAWGRPSGGRTPYGGGGGGGSVWGPNRD